MFVLSSMLAFGLLKPVVNRDENIRLLIWFFLALMQLLYFFKSIFRYEELDHLKIFGIRISCVIYFDIILMKERIETSWGLCFHIIQFFSCFHSLFIRLMFIRCTNWKILNWFIFRFSKTSFFISLEKVIA